ncbi:MAG TPA: lysylphosphatidylglycerol synthase transmembrane domain-containing protein, partial [Acidimicrobiales bacterium]|nr:lysylphosphatidylglycerol synthase transmembrane domain-containing protein [Acidimicrobiales bacterium]
LVVLAVVAEAGSMLVFAMLQRRLLRAGGCDIPLSTMTLVTLAANAVTGTLPGGVAWSATWLFNQLGRRGVDRFVRTWMFLVAGGISSFALFVVVAVGTEAAGNHGPVSSLRWLVFLLALIPLGVLTLEALHKLGMVSTERLEAMASSVASVVGRTRLGGRAVDVTQAVARRFSVIHLGALGWLEVFFLALLNWLLDAAVVVAALVAVGVPVPWRDVLIIYGLTQISASFPITPAGLGIVAGSLAALLTAYGVALGPALAVVILYRILSFWILVPIGWAIWGGLEIESRHRGQEAADCRVDEHAAERAASEGRGREGLSEGWRGEGEGRSAGEQDPEPIEAARPSAAGVDRVEIPPSTDPGGRRASRRRARRPRREADSGIDGQPGGGERGAGEPSGALSGEAAFERLRPVPPT